MKKNDSHSSNVNLKSKSVHESVSGRRKKSAKHGRHYEVKIKMTR